MFPTARTSSRWRSTVGGVSLGSLRTLLASRATVQLGSVLVRLRGHLRRRTLYFASLLISSLSGRASFRIGRGCI